MIHSQAILRLPNAISHNVYYVKHRQVLLRPDPPPAGIVLSAANLGQLVRQLVAIDALSYVQSQ